VPSISVISNTSLLKLKEFATSGGKVLLAGNLPGLVVNENFISASNLQDIPWALQVNAATNSDVFLDLLPQADFKTDKPLPQIKYLHRIWKDADLYFIFNESRESVEFNATFNVKGKREIWDAGTGVISKFKGSHIFLGPWETKFIIIK